MTEVEPKENLLTHRDASITAQSRGLLVGLCVCSTAHPRSCHTPGAILGRRRRVSCRSPVQTHAARGALSLPPWRKARTGPAHRSLCPLPSSPPWMTHTSTQRRQHTERERERRVGVRQGGDCTHTRTPRLKSRKTHAYLHIHIHSHVRTHTDRHRQTHRHTDRQTHRQTDTQTQRDTVPAHAPSCAAAAAAERFGRPHPFVQAGLFVPQLGHEVLPPHNLFLGAVRRARYVRERERRRRRRRRRT
jgi:hypothetical protein